MAHSPDPELGPVQTAVYQIRVRGHLGRECTEWFAPMSVRMEDDGDTIMAIEAADQAALHGLLRKVRDLGLTLISINPVTQPGESPPAGSTSLSRETRGRVRKRVHKKEES